MKSTSDVVSSVVRLHRYLSLRRRKIRGILGFPRRRRRRLGLVSRIVDGKMCRIPQRECTIPETVHNIDPMPCNSISNIGHNRLVGDINDINVVAVL